MKKKILKEVEIEASICNICKKEIEKEPFNRKRIEVVAYLFNTSDFDAHEACINKVLKEAFSSYLDEGIRGIENN